jgi:hypothetical protein
MAKSLAALKGIGIDGRDELREIILRERYCDNLSTFSADTPNFYRASRIAWSLSAGWALP